MEKNMESEVETGVIGCSCVHEANQPWKLHL